MAAITIPPGVGPIGTSASVPQCRHANMIGVVDAGGLSHRKTFHVFSRFNIVLRVYRHQKESQATTLEHCI